MKSGFMRVYVQHANGGHHDLLVLSSGRLLATKGEHCHKLDRAPQEHYVGFERQLRAHLNRQVKKQPRRLRKSLLEKAFVDWKSDPSYRWITVHPHDDPEAKGVPLLIKVHPDGAAHVVGGAGGSMTGMKISRLRSPEEWRVESKARAERREKAEAERKQKLQAAGVDTDALEEKRDEVKDQLEVEKAKMLAEVAEALGWDANVGLEGAVPDKVLEKMTDKQRARLERKRQKHLEREVKKAVQAIQDEVIDQHNAHVAKGLGDVAVHEIVPTEVDASGKGYMDTIKQLAADHGLTEREVRTKQVGVIDDRVRAAVEEGYMGEVPADPEEKAALIAEKQNNVHEFIGKLQMGAAAARAEDRPFTSSGVTKPEVTDAKEVIRQDPERARAVLVAYQKMKALEKEAAGVDRQLKQGDFEQAQLQRGVALMGHAKDMSDEEAEKAAEEALTQRALINSASGLMEALDDFEDEHGSVERHVLGSRFAGMSALYSRATGEPLPVDRRVADLLGADAVSTIAAELMRQRLGDGFEDAKQELIDQHIRKQSAIADGAVEASHQKVLAANDLLQDLPPLEDADADMLLTIQSRNQQRIQMLQEAGQDLGIALGQLEAAGHLNNAMMGRSPRDLKVSMGDMSTRDVMEALRAMGFEKGEAEVAGDGPNRFVRIPLAKAMERLVEQSDPEVSKDYEDTQAIKKGLADEDGWLPQGIKRRASTELATEWEPAYKWAVTPDFAGKQGEDLHQSVHDYAAASLANDGVGSVTELRNEMLSQEFRNDNLTPEQHEAFVAAVNKVLPEEVVNDPNLAVPLTESLVKAAREKGDVQAQALDAQAIDTGEGAYDVIHRTLASAPHGKVAFTPLSRLGHEGQAILRDYFWQHLTDEKRPDAQATKAQRAEDKAAADEVTGHQMNIFGESEEIKRGDTEAWQQEHAGGDEPHAWDRYVKACRGLDRAYANVQEIIKGEVMERFANEYKRQYGRELMLGQSELPHAERHVIGLMKPEEMAERLGRDAGYWSSLLARVSQRGMGGKFSAGERKEAAEAVQKIMQLAQMRLFAGRKIVTQRVTIGQHAEDTLRRMFSHVAPQFDPKKPIDIPFDVSMSGRFAPQQRAVKLIERMKRYSLNTDVGSGKTVIGLGTFSHLHSQGKVKRGVFVVPPKQQGQWGSEALRYLEPGRFRHFVGAGTSPEERRAAYAHPDTHLVMVGHQMLRDDVTWAVAQDRFGGDVKQARTFLYGGSKESTAQRDERSNAVKQALTKQGWNFDFMMMDEGHDALNRRGKENSRLANVMDAVSGASEYYVNATATAVKNDVSEAWDLLHKLRPDRYPAEKEAGFMRKFGGLPPAAQKEALQRELAPYAYAQRVPTGAQRHMKTHTITMTPTQKSRYREVMAAYRTAKTAKVGTPEHTEAVMKLLRPEVVEKLSPEERTAQAAQSAKFLGSSRDTALGRVLYGHDTTIPPDEVAAFKQAEEKAAEYAKGDLDGGQLPGIIFGHHPGAVRRLAAHLKGKGYRVAVIDGTMNGLDVDAVRQGFFPQGFTDPTDPVGSVAKMRQAAKYDIVVCSDAASHGLNLHRAGWLHHIDPPYTDKTVQQRNGRVDRIGQLHPDVHISDTSYSDAPYDLRRRNIAARKAPITGMFQQPYELLDQDESGMAPQLIEQRDSALTAHTLAAVAGPTEEEARRPVSQEDLDYLNEQAAAAAAGQGSMF